MITCMNTDIAIKKLAEEKKEVEQELSEVAVRDPKTGDWQPVADQLDLEAADDNDMGDKFESLDSNEMVTHELVLRLSDIVRAEEKIKKGSFGTCEVCGKVIEEGRLEANPAARTCVEHKEQVFN